MSGVRFKPAIRTMVVLDECAVDGLAKGPVEDKFLVEVVGYPRDGGVSVNFTAPIEGFSFTAKEAQLVGAALVTAGRAVEKKGEA